MAEFIVCQGKQAVHSQPKRHLLLVVPNDSRPALASDAMLRDNRSNLETGFPVSGID